MTRATLHGRTILMSGGSRGIGLAIALRAAADGANVAFLAKTHAPHPTLEGTVHTAADAVARAGGGSLAIVGDVRRDEDIARAVAATVDAFGGIDIIVNNASAIDLSGNADLSAKKYDLMQDVNVRGTFMLSRAALVHLREAHEPRILSLSPPLNTSARWLSSHTGYSLSKFGMTMATLGLAADLEACGGAATTLWPRTTIATAAVRNVIGGEALMKVSRTPAIYADAAYEVLTAPPAEVTGRSLIVEDVLGNAGVTDFARYAAVPGTPDEALFPDIFLD